jgi:hypothetical protein
MWIKATNGNVIEIDDAEHALRAVEDGHEVFESNPSAKGAKKWKSDGVVEEAAVADSE